MGYIKVKSIILICWLYRTTNADWPAHKKPLLLAAAFLNGAEKIKY